MGQIITADQLKPGDVLLYKCNSMIARAIRFFDGTEVSHAALCLDPPKCVGEALAGQGLIRNYLGQSINPCECIFVRRRHPEPENIGPVIKRAQFYLAENNRYAYEQILLLAIICSIRKADMTNPTFLRLAQVVVDSAISILDRFQREDKEPMICSEFVFRCYDEADNRPGNPYSIKILSQATQRQERLPLTVHPDSLWGKLLNEGRLSESLAPMTDSCPDVTCVTVARIENIIEEYLESQNEPSRAKSSRVIEDAENERLTTAIFDSVTQLILRLVSQKAMGAQVIANWVTPGDLFRSPSLKEVGTMFPRYL